MRSPVSRVIVHPAGRRPKFICSCCGTFSFSTRGRRHKLNVRPERQKEAKKWGRPAPHSGHLHPHKSGRDRDAVDATFACKWPTRRTCVKDSRFQLWPSAAGRGPRLCDLSPVDAAFGRSSTFSFCSLDAPRRPLNVFISCPINMQMFPVDTHTRT